MFIGFYGSMKNTHWTFLMHKRFFTLEKGSLDYKMFFTLRKENVSFKNWSLNASLGNQKWLFHGITAKKQNKTTFGTFIFKSVIQKFNTSLLYRLGNNKQYGRIFNSCQFSCFQYFTSVQLAHCATAFGFKYVMLILNWSNNSIAIVQRSQSAFLKPITAERGFLPKPSQHSPDIRKT